MDAAVNLLADARWSRLPDLAAGLTQDAADYAKPVFQFGRWKCLVGKTWVTFWRLCADGLTQDMVSFKTADLDTVAAKIKAVAEPPRRAA